MDTDNFVDDLLFTQFLDKFTIIKLSPRFVAEGEQFGHDMGETQALRNNLAHATEYAASREAAAKVCDTVRKIEHWIKCLSQWPSTRLPSRY